MKISVIRTTRTGLKILLRPVEETDKLLVKDFLNNLSVESLRYRFLSLLNNMLDDFLSKFFIFNFNLEIKILVLIERNKKEELVGIGQFHIDSDDSLAEVALVVSDNYQNKGIGRELLTYMMQLAINRGLKGFEGIVLTNNRSILHICATMGFGTFEKTLRSHGVYELKMYF
ncbi:acetyltransferase, N-acetylglutamate synthase [Desulfoscipio gibsoniae DSM 7213]|uniref:Acetyltransferase, N-acetylglutamate synthase n=2 Tax=Desulfoscipio gibsoniae TaxID=102134 RepID=R4KPS8_9FIRM|nr:acetyltransferase, N-acetylglutamate synthase [Desulfoscipio gibsoniae DSM 7213]